MAKMDLRLNDSPSENGVKPVAIVENVYGVFPSLALLAGMQLDLFTHLQEGSMDAETLAAALGVQEEKLRPLLYLIVKTGLLSVENGQFSNTEESDKFLVRGRPDYLGELSGFYKMLMEIGLKSSESIRTGRPQAKLDFHDLPAEELLGYFQKQYHHSLRAGREIAGKYDFSKFERLLDAGGGSGGVAIALCAKYPRLQATVADLPKVARLAEHFIAEAGLSGRIGISTNDLRSESPAGAYDVAILRALLQTLSKEDAAACLESVSRSMSPGGRLFIFGNILDDSHLGPQASLAYSLVFLNSYDDGQAYTQQEYREMLARAGFKDILIEYEVLTDGMCLASAVKK